MPPSLLEGHGDPLVAPRHDTTDRTLTGAGGVLCREGSQLGERRVIPDPLRKTRFPRCRGEVNVQQLWYAGRNCFLQVS